MVSGTASDVGKSQIVAGLCRLFARRGIKVAPFKGQNMALNSYVTSEGHEIGRAQASQAHAGGIEPEVAMNPVLLKPTGESTSQVVVMGEVVGEMDAARYQGYKDKLFPIVQEALADLRSRYDLVIAEGAGSPAEINLASSDIVNLRLAQAAAMPAILVGDIERGGVFAALVGTLALLPPAQAGLVKGFVVNKFRGDQALLAPGIEAISARCAIPSLGVIPFEKGLTIDAEDSLGNCDLAGQGDGGDWLDVAVIRFPAMSNFTDFDPLGIEGGVGVRYVTHPGGLGDPDLVVLPGSKATVSDLSWLVRSGMADAVAAARRRGSTVIGICAGYQMMGEVLEDPVESRTARVDGLGWLEVNTRFDQPKITRQRGGFWGDLGVEGYQIHHGRVTPKHRSGQIWPWFSLADAWGEGPEGVVGEGGSLYGTTLHGIFENDGLRRRFLSLVAGRRGKARAGTLVSFHQARQAQHDRLAGLIESHLDVSMIESIIDKGAP